MTHDWIATLDWKIKGRPLRGSRVEQAFLDSVEATAKRLEGK